MIGVRPVTVYVTADEFVLATTVDQLVLSRLCSILYPERAYELSAGVVQSNFIRVSSKATPVNPVTWEGTSPALSLTFALRIELPSAFVA